MTERFFDTNVLFYLVSTDSKKADTVEALLAGGGIISVQVLNEFTSVALRKVGMSIAEVREVLDSITSVCQTLPLTIDYRKALHD